MGLKSGQANAPATIGGIVLAAAGNGPLRSLTLVNTDGSVAAYIGPTGVTATTGYKLAAGATLRLDGPIDPASVYAITATSTAVIAWAGT